MEINTTGMETMEFHAYANRLHDEAYNMLLEHLTEEELEGMDHYVNIYTTIMSSFISLAENMESLRQASVGGSKYYNALVDSIKYKVEEILDVDYQ